MNPVARLVGVKDSDARYDAIMLWCPGCEHTAEDGHKFGGLHMLPVTGSNGKRPTWGWNGSLENVTLEPSILTHSSRKGERDHRCHSFLRNGQWQFLSDCTHELANQTVPMVPLPDWVVRDAGEAGAGDRAGQGSDPAHP